MITDLTPYRKHVDQFDLTEEEKLELVNSVWMIVESIFDHHLSVNQVIPRKKFALNSGAEMPVRESKKPRKKPTV